MPKIADRKIEMIEWTTEWMKKYQRAEWPTNQDKVEQEIKNKIIAALAEEMKHKRAFTAWVLYSNCCRACQRLRSQGNLGIIKEFFLLCRLK